MLTTAAFPRGKCKEIPKDKFSKADIKLVQDLPEKQNGLSTFTSRIRIKPCAVWVQMGLWGGGMSTALSLRPRGTCYPLTVHPTGKLSLQPAITFDCICLYNLETLFIQPKTLPSSGRVGSIESMASDSIFFSPQRFENRHVFFLSFFHEPLQGQM